MHWQMPLLMVIQFTTTISFKSPCYLDVETAFSLAESEQKVARISEPLPVWFNSDF